MSPTENMNPLGDQAMKGLALEFKRCYHGLSKFDKLSRNKREKQKPKKVPGNFKVTGDI